MSKWEVFDRTVGVAHYEVPFEWLARLLTRRPHLDYARPGEGYVFTSGAARIGRRDFWPVTSGWEVFNVTDGRPLLVVPSRRLAVLLSRHRGWDFARPGEGWEGWDLVRPGEETKPQRRGGLLRRFARSGGQTVTGGRQL